MLFDILALNPVTRSFRENDKKPVNRTLLFRVARFYLMS